MPKENSNTKNLFFKKSFATHLGGSSSSLDSQEQRKTEEPNNNHEESNNGDSEPGPTVDHEVEAAVEEVLAPLEPVEPAEEDVEEVPDSPQSKPGKRPIRGKPRGDSGDRSRGPDTRTDQGIRTPKSPREQKLNRPNKDSGSGRKTYGRSGPLSSHQYRGPGHHHNRPHPVHAQPHYPGHPMAGMFPGPPVHAMHHQQYTEHLSQSPLESGFVMPVHASPRRTPRHSESDSCGSPVFPGGMPYQGHTQSPYASPPPTSPRNRMQEYYDSPPVQVPIMHHPRFPHHSPYDSPPTAPSPLNYGNRGEAHAQGLQQRYSTQQRMATPPTMHAMPPNMQQVPVSMMPQNMVQPEYLMQVSQQGQLRAQQPEQQLMLQQQQMWQQMQALQQQRMQQNMIQQQEQQSLQQTQMMAATPQMMATTPQMMATTPQMMATTPQMMAATPQMMAATPQMMAANQQAANQQIASQQMFAQQLAHMQTMFTPEQMQQMMLYMQQPQAINQMLMQQKQLPQPQIQQVQPNLMMNPQSMASQEMIQQFPTQLTRPGVQPNMQAMQPGMQQFQNMQQQMALMNLAGQQQAFAQGVRNPGFMAPHFPPPMPPSHPSTPEIPRSTPVPLEDPAIITTNPNDTSTVFGGPGSAFVEHSEQTKPPPHSIPIPKPDLPQRVSPHLPEPEEEETPVPKPSSVDPITSLTEQPKKNTPGIIHLPPAFPTEEEMMLSPDSTSGTPHSMKKNYWQMRQKSTEESPTTIMTKNIFPSDESPATALTKNIVAETRMKEVAEKDETETSPPETKEDIPVAPPPIPETPKKVVPPVKGKEPKQFCLSDFSALVSDTVTHNSKLPKTTMPSGVGSVEVIPNESMMRSGRLPHGKEPSRDKHRETHWRAHDIREKEGVEQWRPHSRESREREFEKLNSWRDPKPKDVSVDEDERRARILKEAEAKGMSEGEQIEYTLNKLKGMSPQPKRPSESSVVDDDLLEGIPRWYDDDEDDNLNPFDLNI